jgi:hypothetical protein
MNNERQIALIAQETERIKAQAALAATQAPAVALN